MHAANAQQTTVNQFPVNQKSSNHMSTQQTATQPKTATLETQAPADFERLLQKEYEPFSAFGSISHFKDAQRMAMALCKSSIVPEGFRGEDKIGDCVIALEIANRIGASVLAVMQNIVIIYGKVGWSAQFLISCVNASRRFSPLRYAVIADKDPIEVPYSYTVYNGYGQDRKKERKEGKEKIVNKKCVAWAIDKTGERLESPEVSLEMAIKEGWFHKDGSKWKTMPDLMLRYRAATFFSRLYAPELTMGIQSADEVEDTIDTVAQEPKRRSKTAQTEEQPKFGEPVSTAGATSTNPTEAAIAPAETKNAPADNSTLKTQPELAEPDPDANTPQGKLRRFLEDAGVKFDRFRDWAGMSDRLKDADSFGSWAELPGEFCETIAKDAKGLNKCITLCR